MDIVLFVSLRKERFESLLNHIVVLRTEFLIVFIRKVCQIVEDFLQCFKWSLLWQS